MKTSNEREFMTPQQVADLLMISPGTVRVWAQNGHLPAQLTKGGHRRYLRSDIELFRQQWLVTATAMPSHAFRILLVDDDPVFTELIGDWLAGKFRHGRPVQVAVADNGFAAGQLVQQLHPDLILLDILMPGLHGLAVLQHLKSEPQTRDIEVIVLSGIDTPDLFTAAQTQGARLCLAKPLDLDQLGISIGLDQHAPAGADAWSAAHQPTGTTATMIPSATPKQGQ